LNENGGKLFEGKKRFEVRKELEEKL